MPPEGAHVKRMTHIGPRLALSAATAGLLAMTGAGVLSTPAQASSSHPATKAAAPAHARPGGFQYHKVGYFLQWSIYGESFFVKNLVTSGEAADLTQLDYADANVSQQGLCEESTAAGEGDTWADYQATFPASETVDGVADTSTQPLAGNFNQLKELKALYPNLNIVMSIGGWTWSQYLSDAALTPASRRAFVSSCINLFIKGNLPVQSGAAQGGPGSAAGIFDGFDIDWEWPGSPANAGTIYRPQDKRDYVALLAEFHRQLGALSRTTHQHYVLTSFLPANPATIKAGFKVRKIFKYLTFADIQGYDFHVATEPLTNFQSNLYTDPADPTGNGFSVNEAIQQYLRRGAPARKLVVGVPAYARGWTGVSPGPDGDGLYQAATGQAEGTFGAGVTNYNAIETLPGTRYYDRQLGAAYLYDGTNWWTYDTPQVLLQKAAYIRRLGLGGMAMWSMDGDDAQGSLTSAINQGLR